MSNTTINTICDVKAYTSSGTLVCDMTNNEGNFLATGYISRSPERVDTMLNFVISTLQTMQSNPYMLLFLIGWIITCVMGAMVVSRGNPSTVMGGFILAWISSKLMFFNPFSWVIVVLVTGLAVWIMSEVGA